MLMTLDPVTGELLDYATVPVSPTPEYAQAFLDEVTWTPVPPVGSSGEEFMLEVWKLLSEKGYC
jgi:hypothetical protein